MSQKIGRLWGEGRPPSRLSDMATPGPAVSKPSKLARLTKPLRLTYLPVWYGRVWVGGRMLVSMAPGPVLQGVSHSITMDGRGMG